MGEQDFQLSFSIDFSSLERGLKQVEDQINGTFSAMDLRKVDTQIMSLNSKIQELRSSLASISDVAKHNEAGMALDNLVGKETQANIDGAVSKIQKLRNELGGLQRDSRGRFMPNFTPLGNFGPAEWETSADSIDLWANKIKLDLKAAQTQAAETRAALGQLSRMTPAQIKSFTGVDPAQLEKEFQSMGFAMDGLGVKTKSWGNALGSTLGRAAEWYLVWQGLQSVFQGVENTFKDALSTAGEFQQQMVQMRMSAEVLQAAGIHVGAFNQGELFQSASTLAAKYGDNINDVNQNLLLWYKSTGDLNSAIALTNESLKFQVATGTDLEDTYRTLTALTGQLSGVQMGNIYGGTFDLTKTHELLTMIYDAAQVAGGGLRDVSTNGQAMGNGLNNAAGILLHSLEQDGAALRNLGLNMQQIIALNQSLITAMGNTGNEADSIAERMSRLVGGFASLSTSAKANSLAKELGSKWSELANILNGSGNKLKEIIDWMSTLTDKQKNQLELAIGNQRQYENLAIVIKAMGGSYQTILKALQDKQGLDQASQQMNDTYLQQVKQLQGLWQGVAAVIGQELIPVLSIALKMMSSFITDFAAGIAKMQEGATGEHDINNETTYLFGKPRPSEKPTYIPTGFGTVAEAYDQGKSPSDDYFTELRQNLLTRLDLNKKLTEKEKEYGEKLILGYRDETTMLQSLFYSHPDKKNPLSYGEMIAPEYSNVPIAKYAALQYFASHIQDIADYNVAVKSILENSKDTGSGLAAQSPSGSGVQTPGQKSATAVELLVNALHSYISAKQDAINEEEAHISVLNKEMGLFGPTSANLQSMLNAYKNEGNILSTERNKLLEYQTALQNTQSVAKKNLDSTASNTAAHKQWADVVMKTTTALAEVHKELSTNGNKSLETYMNALDAVNQVAEKYYNQIMKIQDSNVSSAMKNFEAGTGSIGDVIKAYSALADAGKNAIGNMVQGSQTWQDAMQQMHDKGTQAIDDLKNKWDSYVKSIESSMLDFQSRGLEDAFSMLSKNTTPDQKAQFDLDREMVKAQQELNKLQIQYYQDMKESGGDAYLQGLAKNLLDMGQATVALDVATAQYSSLVDQIKNSGFFQAFDKALNEVGSGISTDLTNQMFGNNAINNQITAYDSVISKLQQEKEWEDLLYSEQKNHSAMQEANHKLELYMLDQEIKKQQDLKKAEEDRLNHPTLLKKFATTFTKGVIDDLVKQMEQSVETSILKVFMPKQDTQLITAMQAHVKGMETSFQVPAENMNKMLSTVFQPDIEKYFKDSSTMFDNDVQKVLKPKFEQFQADMKDPFQTKMNQFHQDIIDFAKAIDNFDTSLKTKSSGGGSGSGSSTNVGFVSLFAPTVMSNTQLSSALIAAVAGVPESQYTNTYLQQQSQSYQVNKALGGTSGATLGAALALAGVPGGISSGVLSFAGGMSGGDGFGGGFLSLLMGAGGGGTAMGLVGPALGLASLIGGSQNKGDVIGGSLAGILGASALTSILSGSGIAGLFGSAGGLASLLASGPAGWAVLLGGAVLGGALGGLFGPHYNPTTNPDMFASSGYAQEDANIMGSEYTQATGQVSEDPTLKQALGGMDELQYLDAFVKAHPGGQGLSGSSLALWQQVNALTQGGTTLGIGGLHQGNVGLTTDPTGHSGPYSSYGPYAQLQQQIDQLTQSVLQFNDALQQGSTELIVGFNQFGSGVGFFPYVWSIPGYEYPANPAVPGAPSPGSNPSPGTNPNPNPQPHPRPSPRNEVAYRYSPTANYSSAGTTVTISVPVNLDGKTVARSVQSYQLQTARRGFDNIT